MTYQEFITHIKESMQEKLGSHVTVTLQDITKNNDTHLDGLTILSTSSNISPTIYLNYYYSQYTQGREASDILAEILNIYETNKPDASIDVSFFTSYDKVKSRIVFKLINYKKNKDLLKDVPYFQFLDLAIVFNCLIKTDDTGSATILIHNHHLALWQITKDDLYALAILNTPSLLPYDLRSMTDVLKELFQHDPVNDSNLFQPSDSACPMYLLSNHCKLNGSGCILYQNLLESFAVRLKSDLYILPSSIHEVLIIPANHNNSYQELSAMVREVNATQVSQDEILSDHVYYFSRVENRLTM